jgi:hypothetical protein
MIYTEGMGLAGLEASKPADRGQEELLHVKMLGRNKPQRAVLCQHVKMLDGNKPQSARRVGRNKLSRPGQASRPRMS